MHAQFNDFYRDDIPVKHGLPAFSYTADEFWSAENRTVFSDSWVFVGFAHELVNVGDVQPITVAGKPVFLVRNTRGEIAAFHNVCRHRCLKLIDAKTNCGSLIRCPYHCWTYDLDGTLKKAPYFSGLDRNPPEGFSLEDNGLVQVRCATWHDWIFVKLSDNGQDFDSFISPLKNRLADVDLDKITAVASIDLGTIQSNWKTLMENFIEPYHVQFVHRTTTNQPLKDHSTIIDGHCLGSACDIAETAVPKTTQALSVTSRYLTLFPNFVLGTYAPDQLGVHLNIPVGPGQTQQRRAIYLHQETDVTSDQVEQLKDLWTKVHQEDHRICELLQMGRVSDVATQGGFLSPYWEDSVRRFQELVMDAVAPALPQRNF